MCWSEQREQDANGRAKQNTASPANKHWSLWNNSVNGVVFWRITLRYSVMQIRFYLHWIEKIKHTELNGCRELCTIADLHFKGCDHIILIGRAKVGRESGHEPPGRKMRPTPPRLKAWRLDFWSVFEAAILSSIQHEGFLQVFVDTVGATNDFRPRRTHQHQQRLHSNRMCCSVLW